MQWCFAIAYRNSVYEPSSGVKHDVLRPMALTLMLETNMRFIPMIALVTLLGSALMAETPETTPCPNMKSPDPAVSPDGYGQAVGERGETNADAEEGDAYTGDPTYGECDGR